MSKVIKLTVRQGKKVSAAQVKKMGPGKMGVGLATQPKAGAVQGQYKEWVLVRTPYGHLVWCYADTNYYQYFTCGVCGEIFMF